MPLPPSRPFPSLRALLPFALFLLALLILATRLATLLHEAVGHAATAALLGGRVGGIAISLLGGGFTRYDLPSGAGPAAVFAAGFGGILVNLVTGILAALLTRAASRRPAWAMAVSVFALVSLLGAIAYGAMGLYYDYGDPADAVAGFAAPPRGLWIPFLAAAPAAAWLAFRTYAPLQERVFPVPTALRRAGIAAATLGLAGTAYAGLYAATSQRLGSVDAPAADYARAEEQVREKKREEAVAKARAENPQASEEEVKRKAEATPIDVKPEEVPSKFPLAPVLAALYASGMLAAIRKTQPGDADATPVPGRIVTLAAALAGLTLGVLALAP